MRKYINKILFVMLMLATASLAGCSNDDTLVEQARSQIDTPCFTDSKAIGETLTKLGNEYEKKQGLNNFQKPSDIVAKDVAGVHFEKYQIIYQTEGGYYVETRIATPAEDTYPYHSGAKIVTQEDRIQKITLYAWELTRDEANDKLCLFSEEEQQELANLLGQFCGDRDKALQWLASVTGKSAAKGELGKVKWTRKSLELTGEKYEYEYKKRQKGYQFDFVLP